MWRKASLEIQPKGLTVRNVGGLSGLAAARQEHAGQFFTPDELAAFVWRIVSPSLLVSKPMDQKLPLLDSSIGSGRLLQFASPKDYSLHGADVDERCIEALSKDAKEAGFDFTLEKASMADLQPHGFAAALINPPFSLTLESPTLAPFPVNTYGRFGALTKAISHRFAVAQALDAAEIVAAIVPRTFALEAFEDRYFRRRLAAVFHIIEGGFREEGTEVATSILLFGPGEVKAPEVYEIADITSEPPGRVIFALDARSWHRASLGMSTNCAAPVIILPVTGDRKVRMVRGGRWIHLKFFCGLIEARVKNELYGGVLREETYEEKHRHPREFKYTGEGQLLVHTHLIQDDPEASFHGLMRRIRAAGGDPVPCPSLVGFIRRQAKKLQRHRHPFGHVIRGQAGAPKQITAQVSFPLNPKIWGGPIIQAGQTYQIRQNGEKEWVFSKDGEEIGSLPAAVFEKRFPELNSGQNGEWSVKSPSRCAVFPQLAHQWRVAAEKLGIPKWLSWEYQMEDLLEMCLSPKGGVVAWAMGTGKARLAIALCLLRGGKHNLITVEPHLVDEMEAELKSIPLHEDEWQIIRGPEALSTLRKVNVISYRRLSLPVDKDKPQFNYADALRRRIRVLVADEGHLLRHTASDQSRALWNLAAGIRYVLTGTPLANYPRDILSVVSFVYGDATAYQPYGLRGVFLKKELANSALYSERGMDRFRDDYVTLEWVTNEFSEQLQEGAKREVPAIANLPKYREMVSTLVKRRTTDEPMVSAYVRIPVPTERDVIVEWDKEHLAFYLKVAEEFYGWYSDLRRRSGHKNVNLVAILARIGAVIEATNNPHLGVRDFAAYTPLTSKQRAVVERIKEVVDTGQKVLTFCHSPKAVQRFAAELDKASIPTVVLHGEISQKQRTHDLRAEFRFGDTPALLATHGVARTGLNIPEASWVIFYDRDWSSTVERQAKARVLRPQQKNPVTVEYFMLPGSVDTYQAQMVEFKGEAADSGLDWATPTHSPTDFLHLDTVLGRFVDDIAKQLGVPRHEVRDYLRKAA